MIGMSVIFMGVLVVKRSDCIGCVCWLLGV